MECVRRNPRQMVQTHIFIVVLLAYILQAAAHDSTGLQLCNLLEQSIYCTCEQEDGIRTNRANCFITRETNNDDSVFKAFIGEESLTYVAFSSFRRQQQLNFVPDAPLRYNRDTLEHYKISQGTLGTIRSNTFFDLPKLVVLSLDSNDITDTEKNSFSNLPKLKKLELGDNKLDTIRSDVLHELPSLSFLFLDRNQIKRIEDYAFKSLHNLTELALADNAIEELTANTFSGLHRLTRIDLFRNKVKQLVAYVFSEMPYLQELDLKNNDISEVDPLAFHKLPQLRIIYLANNRLRILPAHMFVGAPNLILIDFSENQLQTLTWRTIQDLTQINREGFDLQLKGNKLTCDCRIAWILHLSETTKDHKFRRELRHIKCEFHSPSRTSTKVARLTKQQLNCSTDYTPPTFATTPRATSAPPPPPLPSTPKMMAPKVLQGNEHHTDGGDNRITEDIPVHTEDKSHQDDAELTNDVQVVHNQQKAANTQAAASRKKNSGASASTVSTCAVLQVVVSALVSFACSR
ncbi:connectin-like [Ornithodoros turicata]|uniref:connectin-like n=1 Tax=Ornithodoros turicata TaxID=34597 RepID=UPI00313A44DC